MTVLVMVFMLIVSAILQTLWPAWPALAQVKAPFLLGVVLYYALTRGRGLAVAGALLAGLVQDSLSRIPLGYSSFAFCMIGAAVNRFHEAVFNRGLVTHLLLGAVAGAVAVAILFTLLAREDLIEPSWAALAFKMFATALLATAVTPVVFRLAERLDRLVGNMGPQES